MVSAHDAKNGIAPVKLRTGATHFNCADQLHGTGHLLDVRDAVDMLF